MSVFYQAKKFQGRYVVTLKDEDFHVQNAFFFTESSGAAAAIEMLDRIEESENKINNEGGEVTISNDESQVLIQIGDDSLIFEFTKDDVAEARKLADSFVEFEFETV